MRAVMVHRPGGPDVLVPAEVPEPEIGPGQVLIDVAAIGVNYRDAYERSGLYPYPLPHVPGRELAGTVAAVGPGVTEFAVGDLVATADVPKPGGYAERVAAQAGQVVRVPAGISAETAAAGLLQGMTAHMLTRACYRVRPGDAVLVHAAGGGVGLLLTQLVRHCGAVAIATVSSDAKEKAAREAGAGHVIRYADDDFAARVSDLTDGRGVDVVYDGVGRATFDGSRTALRRRGTLVLYGQASGPVSPVELATPGSIFLTRPYLNDFVESSADLAARADDVFGLLADGTLRVHIGQRYALQDAWAAHADLHARRCVGKTLLIP